MDVHSRVMVVALTTFVLAVGAGELTRRLRGGVRYQYVARLAEGLSAVVVCMEAVFFYFPRF